MRVKRSIRLLAAASLSAIMLAASVGVAAAEPGKNEVLVNTQCGGGSQYTFVIKGEGDVGHVTGTKDVVVIKSYTVTYEDANTGQHIGTQTVDNGKKLGLGGRLVSCTGTATFNHWQLGDVTATFNYEALI
jgi:hypothetical protein